MARPIVEERRTNSHQREILPLSRPRRRRGQIAIRSALALVTTFVFITGWSIGHALTVPGGGTFSERVAEWARSHGLNALVTFGEWLSYNPPKAGGTPTKPPTGGTSVQKSKYQGIQPIIPGNIGSPAGQPLAADQEGVWRVVGTVKGIPAIFKTYVREDAIHTSYWAGIVSMDPRLVKFYLRPGVLDPGTNAWNAPYDVPTGHRVGLLATFNGGFRMNAAQGGFYLNGVHINSLVKGAATEVYYRNGDMKIGSWGYGGLQMGPDVVGVRQNLRLIVDHGRVAGGVNTAVASAWGATLGGAYYVWRSGIGMTADGRIIFVYAPTLSAYTLAKLLVRAGCVVGMQLDINTDWMSFMYYLSQNHPANPTPVNLLSGQSASPYRYYSYSNRDFTAVFAR